MRARSMRGAAACILAVLSTSCVLPAMGTQRTGRRLARPDARALAEGRTTKADLLDRFGPPMAIVGRGEVASVPAANVHHVDEMGRGSRWFGGGAFAQQGDAWFELFRGRRPLRESHRVYYWYATSDGGVHVFLLAYVSSRGSSLAELWALVDEETGRVEDAVFREREAAPSRRRSRARLARDAGPRRRRHALQASGSRRGDGPLARPRPAGQNVG